MNSSAQPNAAPAKLQINNVGGDLCRYSKDKSASASMDEVLTSIGPRRGEGCVKSGSAQQSERAEIRYLMQELLAVAATTATPQVAGQHATPAGCSVSRLLGRDPDLKRTRRAEVAYAKPQLHQLQVGSASRLAEARPVTPHSTTPYKRSQLQLPPCLSTSLRPSGDAAPATPPPSTPSRSRSPCRPPTSINPLGCPSTPHARPASQRGSEEWISALQRGRTDPASSPAGSSGRPWSSAPRPSTGLHPHRAARMPGPGCGWGDGPGPSPGPGASSGLRLELGLRPGAQRAQCPDAAPQSGGGSGRCQPGAAAAAAAMRAPGRQVMLPASPVAGPLGPAAGQAGTGAGPPWPDFGPDVGSGTTGELCQPGGERLWQDPGPPRAQAHEPRAAITQPPMISAASGPHMSSAASSPPALSAAQQPLVTSSAPRPPAASHATACPVAALSAFCSPAVSQACGWDCDIVRASSNRPHVAESDNTNSSSCSAAAQVGPVSAPSMAPGPPSPEPWNGGTATAATTLAMRQSRGRRGIGLGPDGVPSLGPEPMQPDGPGPDLVPASVQGTATSRLMTPVPVPGSSSLGYGPMPLSPSGGGIWQGCGRVSQGTSRLGSTGGDARSRGWPGPGLVQQGLGSRAGPRPGIGATGSGGRSGGRRGGSAAGRGIGGWRGSALLREATRCSTAATANSEGIDIVHDPDDNDNPAGRRWGQVAPLVLNLEDPWQSSLEVLRMELEALADDDIDALDGKLRTYNLTPLIGDR